MILDVLFTLDERLRRGVEPAAVAVIDVLRASSTVVEALANGAVAVVPVASRAEALRRAARPDIADALLCGERRGVRIRGFELGNSPGEFTARRVAGRTLVMSTTNGTPAMLRWQRPVGGPSVVLAAFLNLNAVAEFLAGVAGDVVVQCSGRRRRFSLDDALCAGELAQAVVRRRRGVGVPIGDGAQAAMALARELGGARERTLRESAAGRALAALDLEGDVEFCAMLDRHALVPELREGRIQA